MRPHPESVRIWRAVVLGLALSCLLWAVIVLLAKAALASTAEQVYLPLVSHEEAPPFPGHGIAWAATSPPTSALGAEWWYWQFPCAWPCAHNIKDWQPPAICSEVILLGNEPELGPVYAPEWAAEQSQLIRDTCPTSFYIAGNTVQANHHWTLAYLAAGGVFNSLGTHCYETVIQTDCDERLAAFAAKFPDLPICLTEWNYLSVALNAVAFADYLERVRAAVDCSAVFTERYTGLYWDWQPVYWLVESDGALNASGQVFAKW